MLTVLQCKVKPIKELNGFTFNIENARELIPQDINSQSDWGDILRRHHSTIRAGIGSHAIYGIENNVVITTDHDKDTVDKAITEFYNLRFGEANVLSILSIEVEKSFVYFALIYPMPASRRALMPENWYEISLAGDYYFNNETFSALNNILAQTFNETPIFDESLGYTGNESNTKQAEINEISGLKIPGVGINDYKNLVYEVKTTKLNIKSISMDRYNYIKRATIQYFTTGVEKSLYSQVQQGAISESQFLAEVDKYLIRTYKDIIREDLDILINEVDEAIFGNYILNELIDDPNISDIKVLAYDNIRVKANGKRMTASVSFIDESDYRRFINTLALRYRANIYSSAITVRTDTMSNPGYILRINITTPEINSSGSYYLHMRKIRKTKLPMEELIQKQCAPREVMDYLRYKINTSSVIFCGKGGSGKTTFMNTLIDEISYNQSGLVIQESEELYSTNHPDFMFQHITSGESGLKPYTLQDEATNGLLTDLDYFIIGEIKGGEALYFLNAAATGHKCVCSVHAPDTLSAIDKLADYVMYESKYSKEQAMRMLKEMKVIVYMEKFKVKEISEITGWNNDKKELEYKLMYRL